MINEETLLELKSMAEDEPELWWEILDSYLEQVPDLMKNIHGALSAQDAKGLREAAHSLKGASYNIGAEGLGDLAKNVEQHAQANAFSDAEALFPQLERCCLETEKLLKAYR